MFLSSMSLSLPMPVSLKSINISLGEDLKSKAKQRKKSVLICRPWSLFSPYVEDKKQKCTPDGVDVGEGTGFPL